LWRKLQKIFFPIQTLKVNICTPIFLKKPRLNFLSCSPLAYNPKPLIRTFEASIEELQKLHQTVQQQGDDLEGSVQFTEAAHRKKLQELNSTFEVPLLIAHVVLTK